MLKPGRRNQFSGLSSITRTRDNSVVESQDIWEEVGMQSMKLCRSKGLELELCTTGEHLLIW